MNRSLLTAALLLLSGCNTFELELRVLPHASGSKNLVLTSNRGPLELPPGAYPFHVELSENSGKPSTLTFKDSKRGEFKVAIQLPNVNDLEESLAPIEVESEELGQPVHLTLTRDAQQEEDRIAVTLTDPQSDTLIAVAQLYYQNKETNYEGQTGKFLRAYQRVKYAERGVAISIEDPSLNASLQVLLAPWLYSRYAQVEWHHDLEKSHAGWKNLIQKSPVIDYFSFQLQNSDAKEVEILNTLSKKKNQLRLVYVADPDFSSARSFMSTFNASFASSPDEISETSLFSFSMIRSWSLGMNGEASLRRALHETDTYGLSATTDESGARFWHTSELPLDHSGISIAAVPDRKTEEATRIYESKLTLGSKGKFSERLTDFYTPQDTGEENR